MKKFFYCVIAIAIFATVLLAEAADNGSWLEKVPPKHRTKINPFAGDTGAAKAGLRLFEANCAQCHGTDAEGKKGPNLRSTRVELATPGELEWLLANGSLKNGMPSWSRLPEPQRWQIVTYLKTLKQH